MPSRPDPSDSKIEAYAQSVLDDLLQLSPANALGMAADILDPQSKESEEPLTYADWLRQELPDIYERPFGPHHRWILDQFQLKPYGLRSFVAAPRGSGKTSLAMIGIPLAALAMGTHRFPVIIGNTQTEAEARLDIIRSILETHPDMVQRWPNLRFVRKPRSIRRHKVDTRREIQLAGGRIVALGAGAKVRGILRGSDQGGGLLRVDLLLGDDLDDPEQARSKKRTDRLEEWVFADLLGLGSAKNPLTAIFIGTTIATDAMATRAMKRKGRFRNWTVERFPAEYRKENGGRRPMWPEGMPLSYLNSLTDPKSETYIGALTYGREYLLDPQDVTGAMWTEELLSRCRWEDDNGRRKEMPIMRSIVVAVDPSWGTQGDECGIVVFGLDAANRFGHVLADYSLRAAPLEWGRRAVEAWRDWNADKIVVESAFGTEQIKLVFQQVAPTIPLVTVPANKTAGGGGEKNAKVRRFESVKILYEQHKIFHHEYFDELEKAQTEWTEESHFSPDRIDALATAVHHLMLGKSAVPATVSSVAGVPLPQEGPRMRLVGGGSGGRAGY